MKKSDPQQLIREEIQKVLKESPVEGGYGDKGDLLPDVIVGMKVEDGKEVYRDQEDNMIILTDYEYACNMIGMLEVNGYVCEIKYHHKEEE